MYAAQHAAAANQGGATGIIGGGGSMVQQDSVKIVINREEKVVNHLTKEVNNNLNLMFYDFNDYGQVSKNRLASQSQQHRVPTVGGIAN